MEWHGNTPDISNIRSRRAGLDTIVVLVYRPQQQLVDAMAALSAGARVRASKQYGWSRLIIEEPSCEALELLDQQVPATEIMVQVVELSLDFECIDAATSSQLIHWLGQHIVQPYGRDRQINYKGTRYCSRRRWRGQGLKTYIRPKERSVVRLEWTISSTTTTRAMGIERPSDVMAIDHRAFWAKRLRLRRIDRRALRRQYRRHHPHLSDQQVGKAVELWLKAFQNGEASDPAAQDAVIGLRDQRWVNQRTSIPTIPNEHLLPG